MAEPLAEMEIRAIHAVRQQANGFLRVGPFVLREDPEGCLRITETVPVPEGQLVLELAVDDRSEAPAQSDEQQ